MSTLIAYASKYGCTEKCAHILAEKLRGKVDLYNLKIVKNINLAKYDQVIIGGSVYFGKIRTEVTQFCSKDLEQLKNKKVGLFICGIRIDGIAETQLATSFPPELVSVAVAKECFGGELIYKKLNYMERFVTRAVSRVEGEGFPTLDQGNNISMISETAINQLALAMNSGKQS